MTSSPQFETDLRAALGGVYDIERELTGSGMSKVYLATERSLNRKVVLKVLPPELAAGVNRERFRREIQLAAQLQHPHIVPLHSAGVQGELLYFTMPYVVGESLRQAVKNGRQFTIREVVGVLHDVADALAYAHAHGVIHRDIKPGNVLQSGSHAMVTDFGVAKAIAGAAPMATVGSTTSGMAIGTPAYMAPEQLAGDPAADHRIDVYALGLLGYELLTGDVPFKAASPQATLAAQLTTPPEPIANRRSDVPPALAALLARCLEKDPGKRPQTAGEVTAALDDIALASGATVAAKPPRRRAWLVSGVGVALAAVATWWFAQPHPGAAPPSVDTVRTPVTAAPPALTHDDSLAIARAVDKQYTAQRGGIKAHTDSLQRDLSLPGATKALTLSTKAMADIATFVKDSTIDAIRRYVIDSVERSRGFAIVQEAGRARISIDSVGRLAPGRGGPPRVPMTGFIPNLHRNEPPRRVLVASSFISGDPEALRPIMQRTITALRTAIAADPHFVLIDADSAQHDVDTALPLEDIARARQVELIITVSVTAAQDSSAVWRATVRDYAAIPAYAVRTATVGVPRLTMSGAMGLIVSQALAALRAVDLAPRAAPGPAGRRGEGLPPNPAPRGGA